MSVVYFHGNEHGATRTIASLSENCQESIKNFFEVSARNLQVRELQHPEVINDLKNAKSINEIEKVLRSSIKDENKSKVKELFDSIEYIKKKKIPFVPIGRDNIAVEESAKFDIFIVKNKSGETHKVKVKYSPDYQNGEIRIEMREKLLDSLSLFPRSHFNRIDYLHINSLKSIRNAAADARTGILNPSKTIINFYANDFISDNYLIQETGTHTLIHELGHALSYKLFSSPNPDKYFMAIQADRNDIGNYARVNIAEDFAETVALYVMLKGAYHTKGITPLDVNNVSLNTYYISNLSSSALDIRAKYYYRFKYLDEVFNDDKVMTPTLLAKVKNLAIGTPVYLSFGFVALMSGASVYVHWDQWSYQLQEFLRKYLESEERESVYEKILGLWDDPNYEKLGIKVERDQEAELICSNAKKIKDVDTLSLHYDPASQEGQFDYGFRVSDESKISFVIQNSKTKQTVYRRTTQVRLGISGSSFFKVTTDDPSGEYILKYCVQQKGELVESGQTRFSLP